tara:strand:- start:6771 stop:7238 length:468 start_codon:yes stop_codon:yes gene_type:complete
MGNFFNYITKPIKPEEVDILFRANNVIREKMELYSDFTLTLNILVVNTYLGEIDTPKETKINLTDEDNQKHFEWCWGKVIDIFQEEGVKFNRKGEHLDYFKKFFNEVFYSRTDKVSRESVEKFFTDLFEMSKTNTKADLDTLISIYKLMDNSIEN